MTRRTANFARIARSRVAASLVVASLASGAFVTLAAASPSARAEDRSSLGPRLTRPDLTRPEPGTVAGLIEVNGGLGLGVSLRETVTVDDTAIRLGHLFAGLDPAKADAVIGQAPKPGDRLVVDARSLTRVARAHRIGWSARSAYDQVIVERAARTVAAEDIAAAIASDLLGGTLSGDRGSIEVILDNRALTVALPTHVHDQVAVLSADFDRAAMRVTATVAIAAGSAHEIRLNVTGRVTRKIEVPVLVQQTRPGSIISVGDIGWMEMREDRLNRDHARDIEALIGQEPRRVIRPDQPISLRDLREPLMVKRGAQVAMVLETGTMTLTAKGRALEDGAIGDVIRVANDTSSRIVAAEVTDAGVVSVGLTAGPIN